ncbi:MAG TPA: hypothetical protein VLB85_14780 [Acidimicrobiia bacterium]|nr:hypothetical protein [Acidimicrobiia bacterium]
MDTVPSLDEVRAELAAIHEELLTLPTDNYSRRVELQDRRNELRALSHDLTRQLPESARNALTAEFQRLAKERDRILNQLLSPTGESVGDTGVPEQMTRAINAAIESGLGLDEVEREIRRILDRLRDQ